MMIDECGVGDKDSPLNLLEVGALLSEMMRHTQQQVRAAAVELTAYIYKAFVKDRIIGVLNDVPANMKVLVCSEIHSDSALLLSSAFLLSNAVQPSKSHRFFKILRPPSTSVSLSSTKVYFSHRVVAATAVNSCATKTATCQTLSRAKICYTFRCCRRRCFCCWGRSLYRHRRSSSRLPAADGAIFKTATGAPFSVHEFWKSFYSVANLSMMFACRPSLRAELKSKLDAADEGGDDM
jgi:hypothetical protein